MSVNTRMLPVGASGGVVSGSLGPSQAPTKTYNCNVGSTIDVAGFGDASEANQLVSQGFAVVGASGSSATRQAVTPSGYFKAGTLYVDTTLSLVLFFDGLVWRNPVNGNVVA
jgi:hypothetical protein